MFFKHDNVHIVISANVKSILSSFQTLSGNIACVSMDTTLCQCRPRWDLRTSHPVRDGHKVGSDMDHSDWS